MAKRERFGKFVLLEEVSTSGLGTEYRAAKLAGASLERLVSLIRVSPALSGSSEFAKALMEQAKAAARLHSPNVLRLVAIGGPINGCLYLAYEHVESKSLKAIFERSRRDGFPFAPDQALLIGSKLCAALEYAHGKKGESSRQIHGFVNPDAVLVTHDGDVKVRGFGTWAAGIREAAGIAGDEALYLAPEQVAGGGADVRADVFASGSLLFEMLTGQPLFSYSSGRDVFARLETARLATAAETESLPKPMLEILSRALAPEPSARFGDMAEMRRAVDALMFSGEFNPTTFNLAFFMHSLFREEIEREGQAVAAEKATSYAEFADEAPKAAAPAPARAAATAPPPAPAPVTPAPVAAPHPPAAPPVRGPELEIRPVTKEETHPPRAKEHATPAEGVAVHPAVSAREAAQGLTFHQEAPRRATPVLAGLGIVAAIAAVAGWYFVIGPGAKRAAPTQPSATLSVEAAAALTRVKELEEKLKRFEQEKAEAEAKAAEDAKKKVEAQAAAKGQTVDPAVLLKAQEDARRKVQADQEKRQQEERRRLEEEKRAEEARVQEEKRRAEAAAAAAAAATPPPTAPPLTQPPATPPPATAAPATTPPEPAIKPGTLVNLSELGVIAPVVERQAPLQYPAFALQQRAEGTVELNVLIDERGNVVEAKIVKGASGLGLNQAAIDNVKRRKYRPASKDGVPVKVYMPVIVRFELPR